MARQKKGGSLVGGVILIIVGAVILLEQLDIHVWNTVWRFWPVVLILWGADKLYRGLKERNAEAPAPDKGHEV